MRRLIVVLAALLGFSVPTLADEPEAVDPRKPSEIRADQLDTLFARLTKSDNSAAAQAIEKKIWGLWTTSDSPTAEALLQQATRAMNEGAPKESLSILNRLIGTFPDFAEAWNRRATLYYMMKRDDEALLDIQRVLDLEPRHFGALAGRGLIYQRQKKYGEALEAFQQALRLNPGLEAVKGAVKELQRIERAI